MPFVELPDCGCVINHGTGKRILRCLWHGGWKSYASALLLFAAAAAAVLALAVATGWP
jgi:hypothetical protein